MKTVVIPAGGQPCFEDLADLADFQRAVGGWIECLSLDDTTLLVVNEEGKLKGLPPNRGATILVNGFDTIVGDAVLVGRNGEDFGDLSLAWFRILGVELPAEPAPMPGLEIWTVYDHPSDFPDGWIARRFVNDRPQSGPLDTIRSDNLDRLRFVLAEKGLTRLDRHPSDDPTIVETWL